MQFKDTGFDTVLDDEASDLDWSIYIEKKKESVSKNLRNQDDDLHPSRSSLDSDNELRRRKCAHVVRVGGNDPSLVVRQQLETKKGKKENRKFKSVSKVRDR